MGVLGVAVAVVVGTVVGLVGAGGAIIAVPALVYLVGLAPDDAVPTSLLVVGLSSLAGLLPRRHAGISWTLVAVLGVAGLPASWAGAALGERLDPDVLMLVFAGIMVPAGIRMLFPGSPEPPREGAPPAGLFIRGVPVGLLVGFLTGLLGVGGGFLLIPALTLVLRVSLQQAVGTSLAVIAINSASGFSAHLAGLTLDWALTLSFAAVAVTASFVAARLSRRLDDRLVSRIFAVVIFLVAAWVAANSLPAVVARPGTEDPAAPPVSAPGASPTTVEALSAELAASRLAAGERSVQLRITNRTDAPVAISAASLGTGLYTGPQSWVPARPGPVRLAAGATVSLPVPLTAPVCTGTPPGGPSTATVELQAGQVRLVAADPRGDFATLHQQDCLQKEMDAVARFHLAPELAVSPDGSTAVARILVEPGGGAGSLVLHRIAETPLLAAAGGWPEEVTVRGADGPREFSLRLAPQRCDAHALAEDKVGTLLPLSVTAGGYTGQVRMAAPAQFTAAVYSFVRQACAAAGASG